MKSAKKNISLGRTMHGVRLLLLSVLLLTGKLCDLNSLDLRALVLLEKRLLDRQRWCDT